MCPNCVTPWKCNGPHLTDEIVWEKLEAEPGFSEELRQAEQDIAEGRGVVFGNVFRTDPGGPVYRWPNP